MKRFKEAKILVISNIAPLDESGIAIEGEGEQTVISPDAFLKDENGTLAISYLEENEGVKTYTDIEISDSRVVVKRHGGILSEFVFEEGVEHSSLYSIPPYSFDSQIITKKIRNSISFDGGTLSVFYKMTVGKDARSVRMKIEIL